MKGYIYLLKEKSHKTTYKVGRTNDLARRLAQYNNGKTKIPKHLLEAEGDWGKPIKFSQLDENERQLLLKNNDISKLEGLIRTDGYVTAVHRLPKDYEFEYLHTIKVKDCKEAEGQLLWEIFSWDDTYGRMGGQFEAEWFSSDNVDWIKDRMDEIGKHINSRKHKWIKVPI